MYNNIEYFLYTIYKFNYAIPILIKEKINEYYQSFNPFNILMKNFSS